MNISTLPESEKINQVVDAFRHNFSFLVSPQLQQDIFLVKMIFIIVSVILLASIIYLLKKTGYLNVVYFEETKELASFKDFGAKKWRRKWDKIKSGLDKKSEIHCKIALIEAEKFLNEALSCLGYPGVSVDEKLSKAKVDGLEGFDSIYQAHRVCQDIIRDPNYQLNEEKAQEVIDALELSFSNLNVIDKG